jgi:hypothetical protein
VGTNWPLIVTGVALAALAVPFSRPALCDEGAAKPVPVPAAPPAAAPSPAPAAAPAAAQDDLHAEIERLVGTSVHGTFTLRYRWRNTHVETDQDLYQYLDLRIGDEQTDRVSGNLFVRAAEDLDQAHTGAHGGHTFDSLQDTFDSRLNALLYTAYVNVRPESGPAASYRVGRQYVYAGDTFQIDGASATSRPLNDSVKLVATAYAGVPVHYYEAKSGGDWLAGMQLAAEPWKGGRATLDYTHVQDALSLLGKERNDLGSLAVWHSVSKNVDLYGKYTWLEGPRDATLRATANFPDSDVLVQASYYRLFDAKERFATEFDPYSSVMLSERRFQQGTVRAVKGLGDHFDVEAGASARQMLPGADVGPYNRNTRRVYVTPTMSDLPWKGTSVSVTGESYSGDGERIQTWALDVSHKFSKTLKVSAGSDYSLYAFGPLGTDERSHVRTAYARVRTSLTKALSADVQYTWEKDDVETFHVVTLALVLDF